MKRVYIKLGVETKKELIFISSPEDILVILSSHMNWSSSKVVVAILKLEDFR